MTIEASKERVLRTFLDYVMKDGQVEASSRDAVDYLLETLGLPRSRFDEISKSLYQYFLTVGCHKISTNQSGNKAPENFLKALRSQLSEIFEPSKVQEIMVTLGGQLRLEKIDSPIAAKSSPTLSTATNVIRALDGYLSTMVEKRASDLHLQVNYPVTYRIHGELCAEGPPIDRKSMVLLLGEVLNSSQKRLLNSGEELDFAYELSGIGRFRGNIFLQQGLFGGVFRLIPEKITNFDEIRAPHLLPELCELNHGLILVTGPTGSGKSTTIATMLDHINRTRECHILTLEDPIEFVHSSAKSLITHKEIGRDIPSFHAGLVGAFVENVDVVLVGEIRDASTMISTLDLAEAGVLVLATLHSLDVANTVKRVVSFFDDEMRPMIRGRFAQNVQAVVSMKLLPDMDHGRVAIWEVARMNSAMRNLIKDGKEHQIQSCIEQGKKDGMQTFDMSLRDMVAHGKLSKQIAQMYMSKGK